MLCALERNEDIPGPAFCLERGGPAILQVRRVVAGCQRVAVHHIDPLPRLPLESPFRLLEINGRRFRAWVYFDGSRVEKLVILRPDLEAIAVKREPVSDKVISCFAVLFRLCRDPSSLYRRLGCFSAAARRREQARSRLSTSTALRSAVA
jgi:hypothetical protein